MTSPMPRTQNTADRSDAVIIFGITGDLAAKKLFPALGRLALDGKLHADIIGVARSPWSNDELGTVARRAVATTQAKALHAFAQATSGLRLVTGDYADPTTYVRLAAELVGASTPVFYLATPPVVFPKILDGLRQSGLARRGRVVVEKPFGRDPQTARELEDALRRAFEDRQIFRVDHYLQKEPVEGLQVLRFDNELLEPTWNKDHISHVEITFAERIGTEGRAGFYDGVGATRDVLQNHVLQVVSLLAMDRPRDNTNEAFHDAQAALLRAIRPIDPKEIVRGQYDGYRSQDGVPDTSRTETYIAAELHIDSPRWSGVPFRVRAGKQLSDAVTEAVAVFKQAANSDHPNQLHAPDVVRFRFGRQDGVSISLQTKAPGENTNNAPVTLNVNFDDALGPRQDAYERVIDDVIHGRDRRFVRWEAIEQQWRIVRDILDLPDQPARYSEGSWGPPHGSLLGPATWQPVGSRAKAVHRPDESTADGEPRDLAG